MLKLISYRWMPLRAHQQNGEKELAATFQLHTPPIPIAEQIKQGCLFGTRSGYTPPVRWMNTWSYSIKVNGVTLDLHTSASEKDLTHYIPNCLKMWLTSWCSTVAGSFKENSAWMCLSKKCRRLDANPTVNIARVSSNIFFSYVMNCQTLATLLSYYLLGGRINWLIKFFPKKPSKVETSATFISHYLAPIQQQGKLQTHSLLLPKEVTVNGIPVYGNESWLEGRRPWSLQIRFASSLGTTAYECIHTRQHLMVSQELVRFMVDREVQSPPKNL